MSEVHIRVGVEEVYQGLASVATCACVPVNRGSNTLLLDEVLPISATLAGVELEAFLIPYGGLGLVVVA